MPRTTLSRMHPSPAPPPAIRKLEAGHAMTLQPRAAGVLRVAQGRIWATYDGPHSGPLNDLGDRVVGAGGQLPLRAGQRLVLESWNGAAPAYFSWHPVGIIPAWPGPSHPSTNSSETKSWM